MTSRKRRSNRLWTNPLVSIAAVQHAFKYLEGPEQVLRASTASRRWRVLGTGDGLWAEKFEREGMRHKAVRFEVALPAADTGSSSSSSGDSTANDDSTAGNLSIADVHARRMRSLKKPYPLIFADVKEDRLNLALYAQVFVMKVEPKHCAPPPPSRRCT